MNKFRLIVLSLIALFQLNTATAQLRFDTLGWICPLKIPIYLSGNFAELRSGHFHAGLDMKTQGKVGFRIYAVQKGYVSRIKVSPTGYGHSVYITHPDGYTSVYAHMLEFNIQIGRYVRAQQYKKHSFPVDLFLKPGEIPINQGDVIGLSGNSGSSGGPHLHFEIRKTSNSNAMNGLFLGYPIADKTPPRMTLFTLFPMDNQSQVEGEYSRQTFNLVKTTGNLHVTESYDTIGVCGTIGVGIKSDDFLDGSSNRCGVYRFDLRVDDAVVLSMTFDGVSFNETHYISSVLDYEAYIASKTIAYKLFVEPNNKLAVYSNLVNNGLIHVKEGEIKKITVIATDSYGNTSKAQAWIKGLPLNTDAQQPEPQKMLKWQDSFNLDTTDFKLAIKAKSFFTDIPFAFSIDSTIAPGTFSYNFAVGNKLIPVDKSFTVQIRCHGTDSVDTSKLTIVKQIDDKHESALASKYSNGWISANAGDFGNFVVKIDTVKPTIKPIKIVPGSQAISFKIEDNLSGINTYEGKINDNWVLFIYDPKTKSLTYTADEYLEPAKQYKLELTVSDVCGNKTTFRRTYQPNTFENEQH